MQTFYSDQSLSDLQHRLNRRYALLAAVLAILMGVFIYAMIVRIEWLAMVSASLAGCFAVFFTDLLILPLIRYRRLLRSALSGRHHEKTMEFVRTEPDISMVDGVSCRSLIFLGDPDKHGSREMLLYLDRELPLPSLESGKAYAVRYTGKNIIGIQSEDA